MFLLNFLACGLNPLVLSSGGVMIPDDTVVSLALDTFWSAHLSPFYSPSSSLSPVPSSRMFLLNFLACGLNPLVLSSGGGDDT